METSTRDPNFIFSWQLASIWLMFLNLNWNQIKAWLLYILKLAPFTSWTLCKDVNFDSWSFHHLFCCCSTNSPSDSDFKFSSNTIHSAYFKGLTISVWLVRPDRVIYVYFFMLILKIKFLKISITQFKSLSAVWRHLQAKFYFCQKYQN